MIAVRAAWVLQKCFPAIMTIISKILCSCLSAVEKFSAVCLFVLFAEPPYEVEEGEQDEVGRPRYGRVARVELRGMQLVIQRCALWWFREVTSLKKIPIMWWWTTKAACAPWCRSAFHLFLLHTIQLTQHMSMSFCCLFVHRLNANNPSGHVLSFTWPRTLSSQSLFWTNNGQPKAFGGEGCLC